MCSYYLALVKQRQCLCLSKDFQSYLPLTYKSRAAKQSKKRKADGEKALTKKRLAKERGQTRVNISEAFQ